MIQTGTDRGQAFVMRTGEMLLCLLVCSRLVSHAVSFFTFETFNDDYIDHTTVHHQLILWRNGLKFVDKMSENGELKPLRSPLFPKTVHF